MAQNNNKVFVSKNVVNDILIYSEAVNILMVKDNDYTTNKDILEKRNAVVKTMLDKIMEMLA